MMPRSSCTRMSWVLSVAVVVPQLGLALVIPALPQIVQDVRGKEHTAHLVMTSYLAGYALSMLASGLLADRYTLAGSTLAGSDRVSS